MSDSKRLDDLEAKLEKLVVAFKKSEEDNKKLKEEVATLTETVTMQSNIIAEYMLKEEDDKYSPDSDVSSFINNEGTDSFNEFLRCNQKAKNRVLFEKKKSQLESLKSIFENMKKLDDIGKKNQHIFESINLYFEILKDIQPKSDGWTWTQWWYSAEKVTLATLKETVSSRLEKEENEVIKSRLQEISDVIEIIFKSQEEHAKTASSWSLYVASAEPDVDQVKQQLTSKIDKSGFEICKQLEQSIRDLDEKDPAKFIEDHCSALLKDSTITEEQQERIKQFADTFAIGNDWVLVSDERDPEDEIDSVNWTLKKIRQSCSIYGYHPSMDHILDTAGEYKSTCSSLKNTIEWVYFGGRLAVDPTGALLSLLW